ncbi:hypothetical protein KOR34_21310 [Posidoniimonas corsicana]|uniref:SMODS-associated and fused to various effectors domain-containing protein n=1 Tax=Posidoniimonas corsicana TaxID=1938618 RepID=A0A5C5VEX3_9BACT|nr:SAVED domain-containing protein [Posidoniimonas corsicana]TWT37184.1 hypothetical protein KOR34_21310 [Posidoniimonas corsicana]
MSVSYIKEWVKFCLWGQAGGRCEYEGCNRPLYRDDVTQAEFNSAYIAHIVADRPGGPRGDAILSEKLKGELANLMLLCADHRLVDRVDVDGHPVDRLREMKRRHEERLEIAGGVAEAMQSHILLYGARIGEHQAPLSYEEAAAALLPDQYPATRQPIAFGLRNSSFEDREEEYWTLEAEHLRRSFAAQVTPRIASDEIRRLSVFGLAPIPLLVLLGRLLSDIPHAEVRQRRREPPTWVWNDQASPVNHSVSQRCAGVSGRVALLLELSAHIRSERALTVVGEDAAVWSLSHAAPGNDYMQSAAHLQDFRRAIRLAFEQIKNEHGEAAELHVFPAVPVSAAVEMGRVWMPKADLPFLVYDQNRSVDGFRPALRIAQEN